MSVHITIWEPGRHWWNAVMVPLAILLSPLLLVWFLIAFAVWAVGKLFPQRPHTAADLAAVVERMIRDGEDKWAIDDVLSDIDSLKLSDTLLEALRQQAARLSPPWDPPQLTN